MGRWLLRLAAALTGLGLAAAVLLHFGWQRFTEPGPLPGPVAFVVEPGAGVAAIARNLEAAGILKDRRIFIAGVRLMGGERPLQAGEYLFPARVSPRGAMELLQSGRVLVRRLTVAEGLTVVQVLALLHRADGLVGEITAPPPEGSLLPETYHYRRGDERPAMLGRMRDAMETTVSELWPARASGLPLNGPEEALVLASIVERETGLPEERPRVAAVFLNRLRRGMRLQSDPTVIYGLSGGRGDLGRPLTRADLATPTPYNTYVIDGLPPGAIANPGADSIAATLHPAETDELYFVADGNGGHVFARTLAEHNRNVAKWRRIERQRRAGE